MISSKISSNLSLACFVATILLLASNMHCQAHLSSTFYAKTCPTGLSTIKSAVNAAISREKRMAASLIRLHFHDCFVQGCDASLLLDDTSSFTGEKTELQNFGSVRGFSVIDDVKSKVEKICPGVISCADILAVAARDASVAVSGPTWTVKLGRRDSTSASKDLAEANLPLFFASLDTLIAGFGNKGLSERDMVALSGSHTLGQARCVTFRDRLYNNNTNINASFRTTRRRRCPDIGAGGDDNLAPLDLVTPNSFDNNYYKNLLQKKGLVSSDQVLFSGGSTDSLVTEYSKNRNLFYSDFAAAMIKMGDIEPLTGSSGLIRKFCNVAN
ncbi:hypothetical protein GIB67_035929 [Kingdonia uniflora]|uniref:Peroxidase n=1 Tax=Kingdonia uniflora TaxID=39325 RepID=A0A7J7N1C3_9MAGN|nr:hypothetical protein GIB67_035929 [Kingdonia uniflora]